MARDAVDELIETNCVTVRKEAPAKNNEREMPTMLWYERQIPVVMFCMVCGTKRKEKGQVICEKCGSRFADQPREHADCTYA